MIAAHQWPGDPARPALALHCSMGSSSYWGRIAERLGGRVDLYAFDAPGHGRSGPWDGRDLHGQVTREALARTEGRVVDLIGHSLGATVALRLAVMAPQRVRTLTLVEPVVFAAAPQHRDPLFDRMGAALSAGDPEGATRAFIDVWGDAPFDTLPDAQRQRMTSQIGMVVETNDILVHDRAGILRSGGLEAVTAPAMLIRGGDSPPVIAAIAEGLAKRLPALRVEVVPGAGHMVPITHPDAVAALIAENLGRA